MRRYQRYSEADAAEIAEMYARGVPVGRIAREKKIERQTVYRYLQRHGARRGGRTSRRYWTAGEQRLLERLVAEGAPLAEVQRRLAPRSPEAVRRRVHDLRRG